MIARLGAAMARGAERFVPEPIVLAAALCIATFGIACLWGEPTEVASAWVAGFSKAPLLAFALQMCLVLVTGHALAVSAPARRLIRWLARLPRSSAQAAALVGFVACVAATLHWGLGAIVGALLAREVGSVARERSLRVHYPLLGAAAYAGMAVWHGGLSGSAPLVVAADEHFASAVVGVVPVSRTLFSPLNAVVTLGLIVLIPALLAALAPKEGVGMSAEPQEKTEVRRGRASLLAYGMALLGLGVLAFLFSVGRAAVDLTTVIVAFLCVGLLLHGSLISYAAAVNDAARGAGAILLQFPLYFATLGVLQASGIAARISEALVGVASPNTFAPIAFLLAGFTNMLVPSGGGQWAIQGEILLRAGAELGVAPEHTVMAFAYGDAWTNMLQPFWALPLLAIMGLRAKDIIGYTAILFLAIGVFVLATLFMW